MASRRGSPPENSISEASLLEQVRLLKIENDTLRSFIAEKGFGETFQAPLASLDKKATEKKSRHRSTSAAPLKKSPNIPTTPRTPFAGGKGCSCKGNCSTKVCGCVKKNVPCAEFCRCGDQLCQNSEPDKENISGGNEAQLSKDGEESLIKLSKLTIGDKKGKAKKKLSELLPGNNPDEKAANSRSIFSPDDTENVFTFEDADVGVEREDSAEKNGKGKQAQEEPAKISKKKNDRKTEKSKAKNTGAAVEQTEPLHPALADNAIEGHSEPKPSNKTKKVSEKKGKATTKQSNQVDLEPMDETAQDHKHAEPVSTKTGKKKVEIKEKNAPTGRKKTKNDLDVEDPQETEHSEPEPANKINKKADMKKSGATTKRNNRINSNESDEKDSEEYKPSVSKASKVANKNAKKVESKGKAAAASKKQNRQTSDDEASQGSVGSEFESESPDKNLKVSKKAMNTRGGGKQNYRDDSEDEAMEESQENEHSDSDSDSGPKQRRNGRINSEYVDEAPEDTENSENESEARNKNENVAKERTGDVRKRNNYIESETDYDDDEEPSRDIDHSESEPEPPNKNKRVAKKVMTNSGIEKKNAPVDSEDDNEMTSQDNENSDSDNENANRNKQKTDKNGTTMPSKSRRVNRIDSEDMDHAENDVKMETQQSPTESNASSSLSYGTDTLVVPESDDFNPMKPRRQLSRSPLDPKKVQRPHRIDPSSVPLPIPVKEEPEEEVPPPAELAKDIVEDWDEHLAMLVKCSKCGRTFHPHRIKVHEMSCKKI